MQAFPLANVLVKIDDFAADHPELYYRAQDAVYDEHARGLAFSGTIDFSTYFNALSLRKWKRYANLGPVRLVLEMSGDACDILFQQLCEEKGALLQHEAPLATIGPGDGFCCCYVELPESDAALVSFSLRSRGRSCLRSAAYVTMVEASAIRPVRLALSTTTFRKEDFIVPNIKTVEREVLSCDEPIADAFHMFVVDNGRTLDADGLTRKGVTVIPNANVGGAGGFARGMMAALEGNATHVLLMDDDVRVSPESFKRTFNLLSLLKDEYAGAFLNGAMLSLEQPNLQYEDVAMVRRDGLYDKIKPDLLVDRVDQVVKNETIDVELNNAYGAWWYCCIPASAIREHGLPLPLFVRCDDVEFGMRCRPRMMSMGGICVWHAGFEGRFRASVDCYQYVRNFLIMIAVDGRSSERLFMLRLLRTFAIYLRSMNYESAELLLDGLEDYLKGPKFLEVVNGEELMKLNGAKNERLVPVDELDRSMLEGLDLESANLGGKDERSMLLKLLEALPHDRHMLPDALISDAPAAVYYSRGAYPGWKTMRRRTLVAFDAQGANAHVRVMDRARYHKLKQRYRTLKRDYEARKEEVAEAYRQAMPYLTSEEFWRSYLGMS
ncbi:hypothetical protein B5F44_06570 [Gordonibacter urolithinfaciens]|uniref:glycosyltransferase n=1 Tax=Gordonibacter urolithinfaciens TaxID=1335613 RepID=UPI000B398DBC|nr:glycosyltransferase [Gordonibacter urolithinfaciens]OUO87450.1 hypothetical protein B5F44_06570 [Gordonibacter urolithinfaciens]